MLKILMSTCLVFFITVAALPVNAQQANSFSYVESNEIIANPERGLQKYSITNSFYYTMSNYSNIDVNSIRGWRESADKVTVIYRYFLLENFMSADINQTYLANIQMDFDRIREAGLKCLVRFSYTNRQGTTPQQPSKAQILRHINQLGPILAQNQDVIVAHQAGFIGTWGEWYYTNSAEFGTDGAISPLQWANRKDVVDAMLAVTPAAIPIQVRYPQIKQIMYGSTPLNEETAYSGTPSARVGFFNDAFLNVWGDMGTYRISGQNTSPVGSADFNFIANESKYLPMSGETNGLNPPRTNGGNALIELDLTNWSIINRDYHSSVINGWISSGHFPEMLRKLGYRFVLRSAGFTQDGPVIRAGIVLDNVGYTRAFVHRNVFLVFKHTGSGAEHRVEIDTDVRRWESNVELSAQVGIEQLTPGSYDVFLHVPDSRLSNRAEYAIRFANTGVWQPDTGMNKLGEVTITDSGLSTPKESGRLGPDGIRLHQNYANPFNPSTMIRFELDQSGPVCLKIYDSSGRYIQTLRSGVLPAGQHQITWDASQLSSGSYLVMLDASGASQSIMTTLLK